MNPEYYNHFENPIPATVASDSNTLCLLSLCEQNADGQNLRTRVGNLLNRLDSDVFTERELADRALRALDRSALPLFAAELKNPRSAEVAGRLNRIYRAVSGADEVSFTGNVGRDGVGRLREVRDNMSITYRDVGIPGRHNQIDSIGYERAGGWNIVRQADGTYTISQNGSMKPMESGVRISMDHNNGNVRAVLQDGSAMIIPPAGIRWWYREGDVPPPIQD